MFNDKPSNLEKKDTVIVILWYVHGTDNRETGWQKQTNKTMNFICTDSGKYYFSFFINETYMSLPFPLSLSDFIETTIWAPKSIKVLFHIRFCHVQIYVYTKNLWVLII